MLIYGMFRRRSHVRTNKLFNNARIIRSLLSSQAKAKELFQRHLQLSKSPSSLRLAVVKVEVILQTTSAKPWSATAHAAVTEEPLTLRLRPT